MKTPESDAGDALIAAWHTSNRVTTFMVESLPPAIWNDRIPGKPQQTVGMLAAHLHNSRCSWIRHIGGRHGVPVPKSVSIRTVRAPELLRALARSSEGILRLIDLGLARGGSVPRATWQNFPTDLVHFLNYFVAHEAHHRGQLCLIARQLGHRLPVSVTGGLWQWIVRSREVGPRPRATARSRTRRR
jgi:uncharacterized damage-inducible protein DinB